jgi:hypothetical protein
MSSTRNAFPEHFSSTKVFPRLSSAIKNSTFLRRSQTQIKDGGSSLLHLCNACRHCQDHHAGDWQFSIVVDRVKVARPFALYNGALASATFVGHYPWYIEKYCGTFET